MLPVDPATDELAGDDTETQIRQCFINVQNMLEKCSLDLSYVLKTTFYLTDINDLDLCDRITAEYFSEPYPARTAMQVCALPKAAKVQIEFEMMDYRCLEVLCCEEHEEEDECCEGCCR